MDEYRTGPDGRCDATGPEPIDSGMVALLVLLRLNEIQVGEEEIRRRSGLHHPLAPGDIVEGAQDCGMSAELLDTCLKGLDRLPTPFIAQGVDDDFVVVTRIDSDGADLIDPRRGTERRVSMPALRDAVTGIVVLARPARRRRVAGDRFGLSSLLPGLLRYRGAIAQMMVASLFLQLFAMASPLFTMVVIDKVLSTGSLSTLDVLIIGLAAIALFDLAIALLRGTLFGNVTNRVDVELVARLFRHLTRLPMSYFSARQTGDTIARFRELETVRQFLTGPTLTAAIDGLFAVVFLFVMAQFSLMLTAIVAVAIVLMLVSYGVFAPLMRKRLERRFATGADNQSFLVEALSGVETMKALSLEPQMQREWEERTVEQTRYARESEQLSGTLAQIAQFLSKGTVALTLWLGAQAVISGDMTAGQLIAFNMMVGRVMAPAMRLAQLFRQFSQTRVSIRRLADILDTPTEPRIPVIRDSLPAIRGGVRFEQVSFRYGPDSPDAIRDLSFEAKPGEVVGVVGASGAGKSSLLRLLQRLYVPQNGRILVDGVNIAEVDPTWLRREIGAVTQDCVLFNASVRDNIAAARPHLPMAAIEQAARLAAADEFIRALPQAYDTPVGERGAQLSVGQRQRIALARALAASPRMLLLDEPTSALDAVAERTIQQNLAEMVRDRTVFIVAHRLSTLRVCDRILVLENGGLKEAGPPRTLLRRNGALAGFARAQRPFQPRPLAAESNAHAV